MIHDPITTTSMFIVWVRIGLVAVVASIIPMLFVRYGDMPEWGKLIVECLLIAGTVMVVLAGIIQSVLLAIGKPITY